MGLPDPKQFLREIFAVLAHTGARWKKQTQNTAKQNYPGSVASYDTRPGNKVSFIGLFYNALEPIRGIL